MNPREAAFQPTLWLAIIVAAFANLTTFIVWFVAALWLCLNGPGAVFGLPMLLGEAYIVWAIFAPDPTQKPHVPG